MNGKASLALWQGRKSRAHKNHLRAKKRGDSKREAFWIEKERKADAMIARRKKQIAESAAFAPRIITARQMNLRFANVFGALGEPLYVTGHHTAGPTNKTVQHGIDLFKSYHVAHAAKGWGGEGYAFAILRDGTILALRPVAMKGAHVGGHNSNNIGIAFPGTTGDTPTEAQRASYAWLLANAHTRKMPAAHRTSRDLRKCKRYGHKEWSGHASNACPGTHLPLIKKGR
jgi:hypothetical protein